MGIGATAGVAAVGGIALSAQASDDKTDSTASSSGSGSLVFDKDAYSELTTTITDTDGTEHSVTYHFWKAITYVAKPVDETYQSLIVSAPVKIDGKAVDATDAPILLANSVGGYMPSSVADATKVGGGGSAMGGGGGGAPSGAPSGAASNANGNTNATGGATSSNQLLALAAGYVVIEPGARGRTLKNSAGEYYGTAPAAIVDLKAAVRYIRSNKGRIPGNVERIVSAGTSAGGALSALLGASGDSRIYDKYLKELGAADASDAIFATGAWCPITDLEHADGAYEWNWGANKLSTGKQVDQTVSKVLQAQFAEYQASLKLRGLNGFGTLTARNYDEYLVKQYLEPSATTYLKGLSDSDRATYLAANTFITWSGGKATFSWADFLTHVGARKKTVPAFDAFDLSAGENNLFGAGTTQNRHFTAYGAKNDTTGLSSKRVASDIPETLNLMNPMYHLERGNPGRSKHWWIRLGTEDSDTSLTVSANLAAAAAGLGDDVNHLYYWDQGHGANTDPGDFITWIAKVTGHKNKKK
ncbi:subtype B tannase [Streptomyces resistomycificus]|uniref:Tat pathway signal sequence domain protein n=1 Tax=Streptomyces resistomycificus TaxID=67356 RepID=A0A0L8LFQ4_9ACTN|nr:subtype B tannase [Streptomyces resistomycificus]KOG36944.1 Tat pathway signal sequence domain protein [Streptomyces resistomycificus]KUN96563.1 Tat pathway signal sequence domain protein [Streptomyces resistomycificus]